MATQLKPLKWYRDLSDKKARLGAGVFLAEGEKVIRQIAGNQPLAIIEIVATEEPPPDFRNYPWRRISERQSQYISRNQTPQGIAAAVRVPEGVYSHHLPPDAGRKILLLEDIQDPGNAGTLIRTAAAFDFSGVVLTDKCADPFSPKVVQASAGAVMSLWLRATAQYTGLVKTLPGKGYKIIAATLDGRDGPDVLKEERFVLALGNEAAGLSCALLEMADYRVRIPIAREKAESLNAAVCGGILMYLSTGKQ
jgi:TrmH family RNA methyltransferase